MVLTDREIQVAIESKQIIIDPPPQVSTAYSSTSVDLSLSRYYRVWKQPDPVVGLEPPIVSPGTKGFNALDFIKVGSDLKEMAADGIIIEPGLFILGWTQETVELLTSARIAARVEGKSSLARVGIGIHITAPTIHAGFKGPIQLEICNHGKLRVRLIPEMPVCQLIFEQTLGTPVKGYAGQFFQQKQN